MLTELDLMVKSHVQLHFLSRRTRPVFVLPVLLTGSGQSFDFCKLINGFDRKEEERKRLYMVEEEAEQVRRRRESDWLRMWIALGVKWRSLGREEFLVMEAKGEV